MNATAFERWSKENREYKVPHLRLRIIASLVQQTAPAAYVDLGCAEGMLSTLTPGIRYIGVDFVLPREAPAFEFHQCDLNSQQLPPVFGEVDLVTCSGILEYVENIPRLLSILREGMRPGTRLIVSYFNMNHLSRIFRVIKGGTFGSHPDWRNFYSPRDMERVLVQGGFAVERVVPVGFSWIVAPSLQSTMNDKAVIRANYPLSHLFAHHFVWVLRRT